MDASREVAQEEAAARVAAIDIAENSAVVCTRFPYEQREGKRAQRVWTVASTTNAIVELGDHLVCQGITLVVMEATGNYWRTGGRSSTYWRAAGFGAGWSTPARSRTFRAAPRPTSWTRSG